MTTRNTPSNDTPKDEAARLPASKSLSTPPQSKPSAAAEKTPAKKAAKPKKPKSKTRKTSRKDTSPMTAKAKTTTKKAANTAQDAAQQTVQQAQEALNEATAANRDNFEAVVQASQIWFKGSEEIAKAWMNLTQASLERASSASQQLMGCKTLNELAETQNRLAQKSFEELVANTTQLSEMSVKVANEAFEPINRRINATTDAMNKNLAA